MVIFSNTPALAFFTLYVATLVTGGVVLVKNALSKDREYERFAPWSARLLLYLVVCFAVPIGLLIAFYFQRGSQLRRRLARGLFFASVGYVWFYLAVYFGLGVT